MSKLSSEARARVADDLRAMMRRVDVNLREAAAQNLCCPLCGDGISYETNYRLGREVLAFEVATMNPQILDKHGPMDVIGQLDGETTTRVKCKGCPFEVSNGHLVAR